MHNKHDSRWFLLALYAGTLTVFTISGNQSGLLGSDSGTRFKEMQNLSLYKSCLDISSVSWYKNKL